MQHLKPDLDLLAQEYVLVQAWKKTVGYMRYHNWFADTLELDRASADLPKFISRLSDRIKVGAYVPAELKIVPAPKSHRWIVDGEGAWRPANSKAIKTRPLAHVSLPDQVLATAIMLCLSERVETLQGDPTLDFRKSVNRAKIVSYGNRLFCDRDKNTQTLVHRWGSSKLYRAYYQDYRSYLARPDAVVDDLAETGKAFIFQTDLQQFYDRVTPAQLHEKTNQLFAGGDDPRFADLFADLFNWRWTEPSAIRANRYAKLNGLADYSKIALPQGLVAAGFFSNIVLLDFDYELRNLLSSEIMPGVVLKDVCRYVDDIRLTVTSVSAVPVSEIQERLYKFVTELLRRNATGLLLSPGKTKLTECGGEDQQLIRVSRKMERIQAAVSGGFDAAGGEEVIQSIEALVRSQVVLNEGNDSTKPKALTATPDVGDDTISRFAAVRFRTTYRSLRPLLEHRKFADMAQDGEETFRRQRLTQDELDEDAKAFALTLIDRWVADPSNVRLLRVALDLWPSPQVLKVVLSFIEPYKTAKRGPAREIALYCLAEILRAGATETGIVEDNESFPAAVNLAGYRDLLITAAGQVLAKMKAMPWFLVQQARLLLAVHAPKTASLRRVRLGEDRYVRMLRFLQGDHPAFYNAEFAILAIVARRSFLNSDEAIRLVAPSLNNRRFAEIASRDVDFALDLFRSSDLNVSSAIAADLGVDDWSVGGGSKPLRLLISSHPDNRLRNDIGVLSFALEFMRRLSGDGVPELITPSTVQVTTEPIGIYDLVTGLTFQAVPMGDAYRSIYTPPSWVAKSQAWRFQLGFLLRYILTARVDFTKPVLPPAWKEEEPAYRPTKGHWFQRVFGFYNGHEAFGDDWLPIAQTTQDFLFRLLLWPGCRTALGDSDELDVTDTIAFLEDSLDIARSRIGESTGILMIPIDAPIPGAIKNGRPLRGCVIQSVTPEAGHFTASDLQLNDPAIRRQHRNHLSTALAAVEKMLDLRDTHKNQNKRLDWLILPELSVHPRDIRTHLIPFARAFKTAILAGLTYEPLIPGGLLVNSAMWIIPRMVPGQGLQTIIRRQGKMFLSPMESPFNSPTPVIQGFRPCQWLVGYEWTTDEGVDPLWLTGSVCYDGTDLNLASDLRERSDVFAIPALNRDVGTFDHMALALHYHMYQMVIVANNGAFGGSNAYTPKGGPYDRQVFHTHGQPQASISFFEIDDIADMKARKQHGLASTSGWKYPPAGY